MNTALKITLCTFLLLPQVASAEQIILSPAGKKTEEGVEGPPLIVLSPLPEPVPVPDTTSLLGLNLSPLEIPLLVSTMDANLNIKQYNQALRESLHNAAGVNTALGNGIHDFFVIRGVDSLNGSLVLVDGVPEPEATVYQLHNIQDVQLIRGPLAFYHGAGSAAGSVNLVRKLPVPGDFNGLKLGVGSHENIRIFLDGNDYQEGANLASRMNALYHYGESHRDEIENRFFAVNPSVIWNPTEESQVTVHFDYQNWDLVPDAGVPVVGDRKAVSSRSATFQKKENFSDQEVIRVLTVYNRALSEDVKIQNRFYYTRLDWDSTGTVYGGFPLFEQGLEPMPLTLARIQVGLDDVQQITGDEIELHLYRELGSMEHQATLGIEFARYTDKFRIDFVPATSVNILTGTITPTLIPALPPNIGDAKSDVFSLYAMDHVKVNETVAVLLGGRMDWLDFEDDARGTARSDTVFSPFGGVTVGISEWASLYANAGQGFNPPSTQVSGPRGEPEETTSVEGGIKVATEDKALTGQLAVFYLQRENVGIVNSSGQASTSGEQKSQGMELEVAKRLNDRTRIRLAYGYLESELVQFSELTAVGVADRSGNNAPFAPEHIVNLWTEFDASETISLGLGARSVSQQFIAPDNVFTIDKYITLDAAIFYHVDNWYVGIHLNNLTNKEYDSQGISGTSVIPEDGFNISSFVSVEL